MSEQLENESLETIPKWTCVWHMVVECAIFLGLIIQNVFRAFDSSAGTVCGGEISDQKESKQIHRWLLNVFREEISTFISVLMV